MFLATTLDQYCYKMFLNHKYCSAQCEATMHFKKKKDAHTCKKMMPDFSLKFKKRILLCKMYSETVAGFE